MKHTVQVRVLSAALAVAVVVQSMPLAAFAEEISTPETAAKVQGQATPETAAEEPALDTYQVETVADLPQVQAALDFPGSGQASNPYLLSSAADLVKLAELVNAGNNFYGQYFWLKNNISLENLDTEWVPIGTGGSPFAGTFDGNGYMIKTITQDVKDPSGKTYIGLFGANAGTIQNVNVRVSIQVTSTLPYINSPSFDGYYGGVVGWNSGRIENCSTRGDITTSELKGTKDGLFVGGICGYNTGEITGCANAADLKSTGGMQIGSYWGGICGRNTGTVSRCANEGDLHLSNIWMANIMFGGICGQLMGRISDCYNTGDITGMQDWVPKNYAGIAGIANSGSTIKNCYTTGSLANVNDGGTAAAIATGSATKTGCFYLQGVRRDKNATMLTLDQLTKENSYAGYFDFENVWVMSSTGPVLRWQKGTVWDKDLETEFDITAYRAWHLTNPDRPGGALLGQLSAFENTPCAIFEENLEEKNFYGAVNAWKTVNKVYDFIDSPTNVENWIVEKQDIYTALLMNALEISMSDTYSKYVGGGLSLLKKTANNIASSAKKMHGEEYNVEAVFELRTPEKAAEMTAITKKSVKYLTEDYITQAIKAASDFDDYVKEIVYAEQLQEIGYEMECVLQTMYDECTDNDPLKDAIYRGLQIIRADMEDVMLGMSIFRIGKTDVNQLFDFFWDEVKKDVAKTSPEIAILMVWAKVNMTVSNVWLGTDKLVDGAVKVSATRDLEALYQKVYPRLLEQYTASRTKEDAGTYLAAVDLLFHMLDTDCGQASSFVDTLDNSSLYLLSKLFSGHLTDGQDKTDQIVGAINDIKKNYSENYKNALTSWILYLDEDYPDTGLYEHFEYLLDEDIKTIRKKISAACPVNVYLYDETGALAASVEDGRIWSRGDVVVTLQGDEKIFEICSDDTHQYTLRCTGYDTGTMDLTITDYDDDGLETRNVRYADLPVAATTVYSANISDTDYAVADQNNTPVVPTSDSAQQGKGPPHPAVQRDGDGQRENRHGIGRCAGPDCGAVCALQRGPELPRVERYPGGYDAG